MSSTENLLESIQSADAGITLAELLTFHPAVARRSAQRQIAKLLEQGHINAVGEGRARRYFSSLTPQTTSAITPSDTFPSHIPLSADSRDIVAYLDQPLSARKPVGYQYDFLDAYQPGQTWYLSESLRRQLHRMGQTGQANAPAGTYSRAILNRLLIDLSWASSHLEGNTYSRLDTRKLIEQGQVALNPIHCGWHGGSCSNKPFTRL